MSVLSQPRSTTTADAVKPVRPPGTNEHAPVVITEQEVMLGTAAAVSSPRTVTGHGFAASVQRILVEFMAWAREPRPYYPSTRDYLEPARMAREMRRL